ncbi:MAG: carcinine hydrolase/isopenicillin-N N-acyltransferase family protein [Gemmataceae bacterium]
MASDMVVALARATQDGFTFFGHNANAHSGETPTLVGTPGSEFAPGDVVELSHLRLPQPRHTFAVLAARLGHERGYPHGVNARGVAIGCTPIATRCPTTEAGLSGPELVRLVLERAASAHQAVELLTDLIGRHGQDARGDHAFLLADAGEAYLVEAAGRHWVLGQIGSVRAAGGMCLLRQDWDRISRGLSDLAIARGWWPADGRKLDFAAAVGQAGADHAAAFRRWGQATLRLEQHHGGIDGGFVQRLLADLATAAAPLDAAAPAEVQTAGSLIVRLGPTADALPVAWYAFGTPEASVYLPALPGVELPLGYGDGAASRIGRLLARWQDDARRDPAWRAALHAMLNRLQGQLDDHLHEFLPEATALHRRGQAEALQRVAGAFLQHCAERFDDAAARLAPDAAEAAGEPVDDLAGAAF